MKNIKVDMRKKHQKAHPGYYSVVLSDFGVEVELTATQRTAMHRYTFQKSRTDTYSGRPSKWNRK